MKPVSILLRSLVGAAALTAAASGQAALIDRGGGMIYDTTLNITWLADMNYAVTSGYAAANGSSSGSNGILFDGRMSWDHAIIWATTLVYGGFDDWRLPTLNPSDTSCSSSFDPGGGFPAQYFNLNCTGGELSHLFAVDLGNKPNESVLTQTGDTPEQIANFALFSNVQLPDYWSGTEFAPRPDLAWFYGTDNAVQVPDAKLSLIYVVAVRDGDVAQVPEPATLALVGAAILGAAATRRRRPVAPPA